MSVTQSFAPHDPRRDEPAGRGLVGERLEGPYRIGVDIGGTFTDVVLLAGDGTVLTKKVSSTPDDYGAGVAAGIAALLAEHGIDVAHVTGVVHATTVATNAVLEGGGALTGLITTEGFRDVLEFRRVRFPELYNLDYRKPPPLVPRRLRLEVRERLAADGSVRVPLDEATVVAAAERLAREGVEAVAICLLHSYLNPAHEKRVEAIVRDVMPAGTFVCASCDVLPEMREYERTSTTVVNALLGPVIRRYLAGLQARLAGLSLDTPLYVMQSGGGQMSAAAAVEKPAYLVESGPAAGVVAAAHVAKSAGLDHIITLDIGGTTAKTALVENGEPARTSEYEVGSGINLSSRLVKGAGYAIKLPFIDVSEIGAGGGSEVWFDEGGLLKVGPRSAGAVPGPVCYGAGGRTATLTDAVLTLGYLNPEALVGGGLRLQKSLARDALARQVGGRLGQSPLDAAWGVFTVAVTNMVRAVKSVSIYRGRDPRDYTLVAFGGNGPVVAAAIADEIGIGRILVPVHPGVLSAYGLLVAETTHESVRALHGVRAHDAGAKVADAFACLEREASAAMAGHAPPDGRLVFQRLAELRYEGQAFELSVPADGCAATDPRTLAERFHAEHRRTYGHASPEQPVEIVSVRVIARVPAEGGGATARHLRSGTAPPAVSTREAFFGPRIGTVPARILDSRNDLGAAGLDGPLVVEEYDATTVVPPGWRGALDAFGSILMTRRQDA